MDLRNVLAAISLGLSVLVGLVVARGGGGGGHAGDHATSGNARPLIGLSLDTLKEARWQHDRDYFVARCKELGADVLVNAANSDDAQQARDMQSLIAAGCKVIVIAAHDGRAMGPHVDAARRAGIRVLAYDRMVFDCDLDLYISFDNVRIGRQQAQYLVDHLPTPGKGKIVRVFGAPTDNNAKLFKQGQDEVLKPYLDRGDVQIVFEDWATDWNPENAKRIVNAAIAGGKQFDAVLASNDGTAGGAIQALSESNLAKVFVTGQDAELAACQRIAGGTQAMTIYKPLMQVASAAGDLALALANGTPVIARDVVNNGRKDVPSVLYDTKVLTADNMVQTIASDAFTTYDEVYAAVPEAKRPPRPQ